MRVRHFLLSLHPQYGGPTASVPIQCRGLSKEGVDVSLVTLDESTPFSEKLIEDGVHMVTFSAPGSKIESTLRLSLKRLLKSGDDADIYHSHGVWLPSNHWTSSAARKYGKKYVINPRGDLEIYRINYNRWKKLKKKVIWNLYAKKDSQSAACIIATSQQECDAIRTLGITAPVAIIPNGIELNNFPKEVVHTHREKKVVLFLSRVNPIKGLELLIEAWSKLSDNLKSQWELHIAGNSDPKDYIHKLEGMIAQLGVDDKVKLFGPITGEAKMQKYMNSDLFILPTFNENFGNVIAEAMMCECPAITTKNAPWQVLTDDKCGWWIDLSVDNIVTTLTEAMSLTDEQRIELGKKSRQCIINHYSSESVAKQTKKVYEWILGQGDKPDFVQTVNNKNI